VRPSIATTLLGEKIPRGGVTDQCLWHSAWKIPAETVQLRDPQKINFWRFNKNTSRQFSIPITHLVFFLDQWHTISHKDFKSLDHISILWFLINTLWVSYGGGSKGIGIPRRPYSFIRFAKSCWDQNSFRKPIAWQLGIGQLKDGEMLTSIEFCWTVACKVPKPKRRKATSFENHQIKEMSATKTHSAVICLNKTYGITTCIWTWYIIHISYIIRFNMIHTSISVPRWKYY